LTFEAASFSISALPFTSRPISPTRIAFPLSEGAESAAGIADVGEVDVAVDYEGHVIADSVTSQ